MTGVASTGSAASSVICDSFVCTLSFGRVDTRGIFRIAFAVVPSLLFRTECKVRQLAERHGDAFASRHLIGVFLLGSL